MSLGAFLQFWSDSIENCSVVLPVVVPLELKEEIILIVIFLEIAGRSLEAEEGEIIIFRCRVQGVLVAILLVLLRKQKK